MITGSITVYKYKIERYRRLYSKSKWFNNSEYFTIKDDGECLKIRKCGLQIPSFALKFCSQFLFICDLPLGKFNFDADESSEDELVIYYKN